ncbi:MAG: cell division protein FtsH, partial [Methylococcales bacterium]|nr:cell division protein FtsH [Methylococcales bacterium]
ERATELARNMVTRWGFSEKLGPLVYGEENGQAFMGQPGAQGGAVSINTSHLIDEEIRAMIDRNYTRAETILTENIEVLHKMAEALMKWETIDRAQIDDLMAGKEPEPLPELKMDSSDQSPPKTDHNGQGKGKKTTISKPAGQL